MALNWDVSKVENFEEVCFVNHEDDEKRQVKAVTEALIWATMAVGIRRITEKNYEDFFIRSRMSFRAANYDPIRSLKEDGKWESRGFTLAEIKAHIGLSTNASTYTRAKFKTRLFELLEDSAKHELRCQRKEEEQAVKA